MNGVNFDCNPAEVIRLKRDSIVRSWAVGVGDHWVALPWKETANFRESQTGEGRCGETWPG